MRACANKRLQALLQAPAKVWSDYRIIRMTGLSPGTASSGTNWGSQPKRIVAKSNFRVGRFWATIQLMGAPAQVSSLCMFEVKGGRVELLDTCDYIGFSDALTCQSLNFQLQ